MNGIEISNSKTYYNDDIYLKSCTYLSYCRKLYLFNGVWGSRNWHKKRIFYKNYIEILWEICSWKKLTWRNFYSKHQSWDILWELLSFSAESFSFTTWPVSDDFLMFSDKLTSRCQFSSGEETSLGLVDLELQNWADWIEPPRPALTDCSLHALRKQENCQ